MTITKNSKLQEKIKSIIEDSLSNAKVVVYLLDEEVFIEVIHPSFSESDRTNDQKKVIDVLEKNKSKIGQHTFSIEKLLTYKQDNARFNSLANLHTVRSGRKNEISTTTVSASDAFIFLADLDAEYLMNAWFRGSNSPFPCRAIAANEGVYKSFPIREGVDYKELEIQGQSHLIRSTPTKKGDVWEIEVNIGFIGFAEVT